MKRSDLNPAVRRYIRVLERKLERKCRKIWSHANGKGETYLYGSFCLNRDSLVATIAIRDFGVIGGWLPQNVRRNKVRRTV